MTTYLSLFAGVGGFDLGAEAAGWECVAQVEWDPKAQSVLNHHWPHIPKYGDVTDYHGATHPADIVVGGFPCQDVSIAGHRAGVLEEGTRSNLYTHIIRIVKEMKHATNGVQPRWVVLENVRGLLSVDQGDGFAQVLQDLADLGALVIEWALLDSQFFGIPQRRQRVFVAACLDPATADRCPDPLLPVAESLPGHLAKSRKKGTKPPARTPGSPDSGGLVADTGIVTALTAMDGWDRPDLAHAQAGWLVPETGVINAISSKWAKGTGGPSGDECQNLVALAVAENQRGELRTSDIVPNLTTGGGKPGQGYPAVLTYQEDPTPIQDGREIEKHQNGLGIGEPGDPSYTLDTAGTQSVAITFAMQPADQQGGPGALRLVETDVAPTIAASDGAKVSDRGLRIAYGAAVRRITPLEGERLQGWPDNHTLYGANGQEQSDSARYKQIGNGISAPVAQWVAERINIAENHTE